MINEYQTNKYGIQENTEQSCIHIAAGKPIPSVSHAPVIDLKPSTYVLSEHLLDK